MTGAPADASTADYVVVGAGSAGCVLAEALSRDGRCSVIVVEAGGTDAVPSVRIPGAVIGALASRRLNWAFTTEPDPTRDGRSETWHRGRVLGGSGSINGCFFVRGRPADFDLWASLGNTGWSYRDVLPYFRSLETCEAGGDPALRGASGPFHVRPVSPPHPLAHRFVEAAEQCGVPRAADYNGADAEGAAIAQAAVRRGCRESAWRAFLAPARRRPNLRVLTGGLVRRVVIEAGQARGVEVAFGHRIQRIAAGREVILAAGSIGSPHLLLLSGVGPSAQLRGLGIPVHADVPGVGANLQEHAGIWIVAGLRPGHRTLNMDYGLAGFVRHGARFLLRRDGPAANPSAHALAFARTDPSLADPDLQIHFMPLGYLITGEGVEVMRTPAIMAVPNVNRPLSRGMLCLASADPAVPPRIQPRLLGHPDDVRRLVAGCRLVRRILAAPALAGIVEAETFPGPAVQSDAEWESVLRSHAGPVYHVVGTCRMGIDGDAVVDPELRVRGVGRLRVIDSSIMPVITSGNTNATSMMIGARGADFVLRAAGRPQAGETNTASIQLPSASFTEAV